MSVAEYTHGPINRHLLIMTVAATASLIMVFVSDLADMYYLSLLGVEEVMAAVGYAGPILLFTITLCIGLSIACSALVSTAIGSENKQVIQESVTASFIFSLIIIIPITLLLWFFSPDIVSLLGGEGLSATYADQYLSIVIPSTPLLALCISLGSVMRARGDALNSMLITVLGGSLNIILDPIFIFVLDMGIEGAAVATVISRLAMVFYGFYIVSYKNGLMVYRHVKRYFDYWRNYIKVAVPVMCTDFSIPFGIAFMTYVMAQFGDSAVVGNTIVSRIQPVAFIGLYALAAIVGPIVGQNFGAQKMDRVAETVYSSLRFVVIYCVAVCAILWIGQSLLVPVFNTTDEANELIYLFCNGMSLIFIFNGITLVTNAFFSHVGFAYYSAIIDITKATFGTIPFAIAGAYVNGPEGALWGVFLGAVIISIVGLLIANRLIKRLAARVVE